MGDDQLWGVTRRRKGGDHTLAALKSIRAARPDGAPIYVIMDNLSANKTPPIRAWAKKHKVQLCFTPTSASWANPIEAQFGPLRTFVMGGSDHPNHTVLARRLQDYLRLAQRQRPPPRRPGRPAPRTRPHPQRTPATLGPPTAESRMTQTRRTFMDTALTGKARLPRERRPALSAGLPEVLLVRSQSCLQHVRPADPLKPGRDVPVGHCCIKRWHDHPAGRFIVCCAPMTARQAVSPPLRLCAYRSADTGRKIYGLMIT